MGIQRVGHVVIKMRDLEAAKQFYGGLLGMTVAHERETGVFFRFADYHHDLAVFKVSADADAPKADQVGLAHIALVADGYDSIKQLYGRLIEHGLEVHTTDHGMTKSLYFNDPEGNQIEVYCEVPEVAPFTTNARPLADLELPARR